MTTLNINGSMDAHERYKMPAIEISIIGNYTIITNIDKISKSLERDSGWILKYIQLNLSTSLNKNKLSGIYNKNELQEIIYKFINDIVLCSHCNNPETVVSNNKKKLTCKACGMETKISVSEKFNKFISK